MVVVPFGIINRAKVKATEEMAKVKGAAAVNLHCATESPKEAPGDETAAEEAGAARSPPPPPPSQTLPIITTAYRPT